MKPALEIDKGNNQYWYLDDQLHREDGPAVEYINGDKLWYKYDELHREDGPAVEYVDGTRGWWLDGVQYHKLTEYCKAAKIIGKEKTIFLLKWLK